jgi:hypothetical protein
MHDLMIMYEVGKVRMQEFIEHAERTNGRGAPETGGFFIGKGTPVLTDTTCSHPACTASP